jgi:hypothetical protein
MRPLALEKLKQRAALMEMVCLFVALFAGLLSFLRVIRFLAFSFFVLHQTDSISESKGPRPKNKDKDSTPLADPLAALSALADPSLSADLMTLGFGKLSRKRRKAHELLDTERWNCPIGCGAFFRKTSTLSIQKHRQMVLFCFVFLFLCLLDCWLVAFRVVLSFQLPFHCFSVGTEVEKLRLIPSLFPATATPLLLVVNNLARSGGRPILLQLRFLYRLSPNPLRMSRRWTL